MKSLLQSLLTPFTIWAAYLTLYVVDTIKSVAITNADATPIVITPSFQAGGRVRSHRGVCTLVTAAAEATSTLRFCRVKSSDMIKDMRLDAGSFGTGCTMHIGVYRTAQDGGAVRDADFFADSIDMATAQKNTNVLNESAFLTVANMGKRLWEVLGYTVDPQCEFDIVGTLAVAATVAGTACLTVDVVGAN